MEERRDERDEQDRVQQQVHEQRQSDAPGRYARHRIGGAQHAVDQPGLAADLGHIPACGERQPAGKSHQHQRPAKQRPRFAAAGELPEREAHLGVLFSDVEEI